MPNNKPEWDKLDHRLDANRFANYSTAYAPNIWGDCYPKWNGEPPKAAEPEKKEPPKYFCEYCHGKSPDDSRGNCCACGAPRAQITTNWMNGSPGIVSKQWARENLLNIPDQEERKRKIWAEKFPDLQPRYKGTDAAMLYGQEITLQESYAFQMTGIIPARIKKLLKIKDRK